VQDVRARVDFVQERWADATARFRLAKSFPESDELADYHKCFFWLAQRRAGVCTRNRHRHPAKRTKGKSTWPDPILDLFKGEITEAALGKREFVTRPTGDEQREQVIEALYYVGELRLAEGDVETARRHFASVVNLRVLNFVEFGMAPRGAGQDAGAGGRRRTARSVLIALLFLIFFVEVVVVLIVVVIPIVVVLIFVFVFLLLFVLFVLVVVFVGVGPAFRLGDLFQVHLVPGFHIKLLDVAVEIFDLDQFGILVDRQHAELLFFFEVLVPLPGGRFVISAHRSLTLPKPPTAGSAKCRG